MAHLLGVENLRLTVGSRLLLDEVTLGLEDGTRVGVLGPNGAGKSTFLAALAGRREPDGGRVTRTGGVSVAVLSQADDLPPGATVRTAVHGRAPEHEWASDPAVRDIHAGLIADLDLSADVATLSGGQRRRVALAAVLTRRADVVILDEPTNHLDVEGVDWLARHLRARFNGPGGRASGALVTVTHDRWFLDAICTNVWEVVPGIDPGGGRPQVAGRIETYDGGYAAYVLARAERARQAAVAAVKRENLLRKELAWLRRGAPARTSKPRFRIDAAEALIADVPPPRDTVELVRMATARLGKDVIDLEDVSVSFTRSDGSRLSILEGVTWRLAPAERVGIVGVNGAGKTTILNLLRGDLEPTSGRVKRGKTVQVATLSQDTHELDALADMRVVEAVADVAQTVVVDGKEVSASQMTERMGFTRARAYTRISEISGGERRRLALDGEPELHDVAGAAAGRQDDPAVVGPPARRPGRGRDEGAAPLEGLHQALGAQLGDGLAHDGAGDLVAAGQLRLGGHPGPGCQGAVGDGQPQSRGDGVGQPTRVVAPQGLARLPGVRRRAHVPPVRPSPGPGRGLLALTGAS